jgi:hypothetical protein
MIQAFQDTEGEAKTSEVLVEFRIETLSNDGRKTLAIDRVVPYSEYKRAIIATEKDWMKIVQSAENTDFHIRDN